MDIIIVVIINIIAIVIYLLLLLLLNNKVVNICGTTIMELFTSVMFTYGKYVLIGIYPFSRVTFQFYDTSFSYLIQLLHRNDSFN